MHYVGACVESIHKNFLGITTKEEGREWPLCAAPLPLIPALWSRGRCL